MEFNMYTSREKGQDSRSKAVASFVGQKKNSHLPNFGFVDNRPEAVMQRKLMDLMITGNKILNKLNSENTTSNRTKTVWNQPNQNRIIQREVIEEKGNYYSDHDTSKTIYKTYQEASNVDEVLSFLKSTIESIESGVGRMNAYVRGRVARLNRTSYPSWIPDTVRPNEGVQATFVALLEKKEEKEKQWKQVEMNPQKWSEVLSQEGYNAASDVYRSYLETTGGKQAGYRQQMLEHMMEMIGWTLDKIEPHYISSQGDTNRRADSLLITGATQQPQSQYYPPENEFHQAVLVDHKLGYRTDGMAQHLAPSVRHAARALPVEYHGDVLPTTTEFQFPFGVPQPAKEVITAIGEKEREDRPSAFSSGLNINAAPVLAPANDDEILKRQCGCVGLSDQEAVEKIHRVVNGYMFDKGVLTQVGKQLKFFNSLSDWFEDLSNDVRQWLKPSDIYQLCREHT